jgi:hypothetical protein
MNRVFFRLSIALFAVLFSKRALATPDFPDVLKARFNIPTDASQMCTLCHQTLSGGPTTATQPFGVTLVKYGLMKFDVAGLGRILTEMETSGEDDSDGDLVGDIAELRAGTNPNVNDATGETVEQPRYGCYCSTPRGGTAPRSTTGGPCLSVLLLCAWFVRTALAQRCAKRLRRLSRETQRFVSTRTQRRAAVVIASTTGAAKGKLGSV